MEFEWHESKNLANLRKHGLSFDEAKKLFEDPNCLTFGDYRFDYGEMRYVSIGEVMLSEKRLLVVIVAHTLRANTIRIISARKANKQEKKRYERERFFS
ncbi:MAG: BrnT family toxin [Prochloraceae cyanobacterium]